MKTDNMKAVVCRKYGSPEVLVMADRKIPQPKADQVLIKICATSVTNSDLFIRGSKISLRFLIPMRIMLGILKPRNEIIGEVLSGEITEVGEKVKRFKVGDKVYGLTGFSLGAYAEYKCMRDVDSKQGSIALKPENISHEEATAAAYGGLLAFQSLEKVKLHDDQKVLIYGASGTTGTIAIQYVKHFGSQVTAVCSAGNFNLVKTLGADKVLDYNDASAYSRLEKYDIVLDAVGKVKDSKLKMACRQSLKDGGKYLSIDDEALVLDSGRLDRIRALVEIGAIKPINDRVYKLEQIVAAHRYVELGHKKGNVAITVSV